MLSQEAIKKRWLAGAGSGQAQAKYIESIEALQVSPMELAVKQKEKMKRNHAAAVDSGLWERRTLAKTLSQYKQACKTKGAGRLSSGATAGQENYNAALVTLIPAWNQAKEECRNMPNNSIDEALAKVRRSIEIQKAAVGKTY